MQSFEYVLLGLVLIGLAESLLFTPNILGSWVRWVYVAAVVLFLAIHFVIEGPHWQVWPLYLALAISILLQFAYSQKRKLTGKITACTAICLAVFSAALCWMLPVFSLPTPTGLYAVGTHSEVLEDRTRAADGIAGPTPSSVNWRRMPIRVWYPAQGQTGRGRAKYTNPDELKPLLRYRAHILTNSLTDAEPIPSQTFPVILFGPKWDGARVQDTFLAEDLASHGYIVIAVDHPGNATFADTGTSVVKYNRLHAVSIPPETTSASVLAAWADELNLWKADDETVLNTLLARAPSQETSAFYYALDPSRIGALGHSFGGASAMALLGSDPRVKSAVNLDGWIFNGLDRRTTQPIMLLYEADAENPQIMPGAEGELNAADLASVQGSLTRFGGLVAYIAGSQHLDFTDQTLVSPLQRITFTGPIRGEKMRQIVRSLVLGFFDQTLKGNGNIPAYPEVKVMRIAGTGR